MVRIGDVIDAFMAIMVLRTCEQVEGGLPANVKSKMYTNIVLDFAIGLMPILGDVADAVFRANTRNAVVLEKYLRAKGATALKAQGRNSPLLDPTDPDEFDRQTRDELGPPPQYTTAPPTRQGTHKMQGNDQNRTANLQPETAPETRGGGWFSGFGNKKQQQPDMERGGDLRRREDEPLPSLPARPNDVRSTGTLQKTRY